MIGAKQKYVVFGNRCGGEDLIPFPSVIQHSVMAENVEESSFGGMYPISGGFIVDGQCVGRSESLRMDSRGDKDTALIGKTLDMNIEKGVVACDLSALEVRVMANMVKHTNSGISGDSYLDSAIKNSEHEVRFPSGHGRMTKNGLSKNQQKRLRKKSK